jgi:hypothetical protein
MTALRLFTSEQDAIEDRRRARVRQAQTQSRCGACGKFAKPQVLLFGSVCAHCVTEDQRPGIKHKVEVARRWWAATRRSALK